MGKKVEEMQSTLMSIAKTAPLILGAAGGLLIAPKGATQGPADAPVVAATQGRFRDAFNSAIVNYTFIDWQGNFQKDQGIGAKSLAAGVIVHKVLGWLL